jgi:hypothetical protein
MAYRAVFWLFLVLVLPAFLQSTLGCSFNPGAICGDACAEAPKSPNSYMCSCDCGPETLARAIRIEDSADDSEEFTVATATNPVGTIQLDSVDLDFINDRMVGLRFRDVDIPPGATVLSAKIQFTSERNRTGNVTMTIYGEDVAVAAPFSAAPFDLSTRARTTASVQWPITTAWAANASGNDQLTPELKDVLQEIIDRPGWGAGHPVAFLFLHAAGTAIRNSHSFDGRADVAPLLVVEYADPNSPLAKQDLRVCMLPEDVPADAETPLDLDALAEDCSMRVQDTLIGIAEACSYPSACTCTVIAADAKFSKSCDGDCLEVPLDDECSNFDPIGGNTEATNAPGDEPVCLGNSPLAFGLFGRRTTCDVQGSVTLAIEDKSAQPDARGLVHFRGFCPGQSCAVQMEYDLDLDDVTVGNFWGSATFRELASVGKSIQPAEISAEGDGQFTPLSTETSSRGRRGSEQSAIVSTNTAAIDITAVFGGDDPSCSVYGAVVGGVDPELRRCAEGPDQGAICESDDDCQDDDDCSGEVCNCVDVVGDSDMTITLDLTGDIVNRPPTADAVDQTVECNILGGARFDLDASSSTDLDDNLVFYNWLLGGRTGPWVGFDPVSPVEQAVGTQRYVLRVIDEYGQTDELETEVTVEDTTPPEIFCNANPTVSPPDFPISYQATAEDICDPDVVPEVVAYDCYVINKKGKKVDKTSSCKVTFEGDTLTIVHSGGVDTIITWDLAVTDAGGNTTEKTCEVLTVKKP